MESESLEALSQRMLERWRRRREAAAAQPAASGGEADRGVRLMMVQRVVLEDAAYGPHLVAGAVRFEGAPPVVQTAGVVVVRCYPVPGRPVSE